MSRILLASGGPTYAHDHARAARALEEILGDAGHDMVAVTTHPDQLPDATAQHRPDAIVMHMLWWRMLADRYDHLRDEWAYRTNEGLRSALQSFVAGGGGLVALHTSTICFDDWAGWGDLLGAQWNWKRSFHPPLGPAAVRVLDAAHEITEGLADFTTIDEIYADLDVRSDVVPLLAGLHEDGTEHPVLWTREWGAGRVVQFGLGHDESALQHPTTAEIVRRGTAWAVRSPRSSSDA